MEENDNEKIELTYSLTFIQKLINPIDGFICRAVSLFVILAVICGLVMGGYSFIPMWILAFIVILFDILFFGRYLRETVMLVWDRDSSRCIVIGPNDLGFGHKKPEYWISRKPLKVYKGFVGTHLIRIRHKWGHCLIVSKDAISLSELKELIEMGKDKD